MKKTLLLFVMLFAFANFTACTSLSDQIEETQQLENENIPTPTTDPADDGTIDEDPEEETGG